MIKIESKYWVSIAVVLAIMVFGVYSSNKISRENVKTLSSFTKLQSDLEVSGKVKEVYCPPKMRCGGRVILIIMESMDSLSISASNDLESAIVLSQIVEIGDSIVKKQNSDTLNLIKADGSRGAKFLLNRD